MAQRITMALIVAVAVAMAGCRISKKETAVDEPAKKEEAEGVEPVKEKEAAADELSKQGFEKDVIPAPDGDLEITFIGHGTLMFRFKGKVIHVDPFSRLTDYGKLPKADLILLTHEHGDHLDGGAIAAIRKETTEIVLTEVCAKTLKAGTVLKNGGTATACGIDIEAVPAYNLVNKRPSGDPFHPKGRGNGYLLRFGSLRVYVAGDTENTPEMKTLKDIDVAFLPMNLPYTMTPAMVADAAKAIRPRILYPYHFGKTDTSELVEALKGEDGIEVRIRKMG